MVCRRTALYLSGLPRGLSRASYLPPQPRNVCRGLCKELAWSIRSRKVKRIEGGLHRSIVGPSSSPTRSRQLRRLQRLAFLQPESAEISSPHAEQCRPSPRPPHVRSASSQGNVPVSSIVRMRARTTSLSDHLRHACLMERAPEIIDASRNRQLQRHPIRWELLQGYGGGLYEDHLKVALSGINENHPLLGTYHARPAWSHVC